MHRFKYLTCFCCAVLMILTGCSAGNGQANASNTTASTINTNIATVQPTMSNALKNTSTPVKPTSAYTSREPYYTLNPAMPTPEEPSLPVIEGAEFLRPSDEEIAELKEAYEAAYEKMNDNKRQLLKIAGAIVSYENACVGYDFVNYVFRDYDWSRGIPTIEDVRAYMSVDTNYDKVYHVPIYSRDYKLIACMEYHHRASGRTYSYMSFAQDSYLDYWEEMYYCRALPMHTQAYYVYMSINVLHYLGSIQDMMLISDGHWNYSYCLVKTDKGSYVYNRPYEDDLPLDVMAAAGIGSLYADENMFSSLYQCRLENLRYIDGSGVVK